MGETTLRLHSLTFCIQDRKIENLFLFVKKFDTKFRAETEYSKEA